MGLLTIETPFDWRRKLDKSGYEVVKSTNKDWQQVNESVVTLYESRGKTDTIAKFEELALEWVIEEAKAGRLNEGLIGYP